MTEGHVLTLLDTLDWRLVLVYLRLQAFVMLIPAIGERVVSVRIRMSLAMALSPLLAEQADRIPWPDTMRPILIAAIREMVLGLTLALFLRILVMIIDMAASAIASAMSMTQMLGINPETTPHPVGNLLHLGGLAILMILGFPVMVIRLLQDSLTLWPLASGLTPGPFLAEIVQLVASGFSTAMLLAAPFTLGGFLLQGLTGVINRVMPALPLVFITSPLILLLALLGLAVTTGMSLGIWSEIVLDYRLPR